MIRRLRWTVFIGGLGLGTLFIVVVGTIQITSTPTFCGTCHYMKPYYLSWKTSTHNTVACVECHIPPGIGSEIRKKYEAMAMLARYITGTYGTNPWAEVDDESCLRCHEKRLIMGKVTFEGVLFDHKPHLMELRRGKRLRCTSCHSQIVQGAHIKVTTSTCFLCHFKDVKIGEGTAKCTLCHRPPEGIIEYRGVSFNHSDVQRFGMDCSWCHVRSIRGTGEVPRERCLTCHNDPERLSRYGETQFLHKIHVTDHKVECLNCHMEIQHGAIELQPAGTKCSKCHLSGHNPTRDLYAGIGGKGVQPKPNKMFLTGVTCEGCHFLPDTVANGGLKRASVVSCMACHGTKYQKVFNFWKRGIEKGRSLINKALRNTPSRFQKTTKFRDIKANIDLVKEGGSVHNPEYAMELLGWSYENLRKAIKNRLPPWPRVPYETYCVSCHLDQPFKVGRFRTYMFSHTEHISLQGITCDKCHRKHKERAKGEVIKPDLSCSECHHTKGVKRSCKSCHGSGPEELKLKDGRTFPHEFHTGEDVGLECLDCHTEKIKVSFKVCEDCHD